MALGADVGEAVLGAELEHRKPAQLDFRLKPEGAGV